MRLKQKPTGSSEGVEDRNGGDYECCCARKWKKKKNIDDEKPRLSVWRLKDEVLTLFQEV